MYHAGRIRRWTPPGGWRKIRTIDAHAAGEPLRIILDGYPRLRGKTMLARRRFAAEHCDHIRKLLMREPRGHREMYGCIVTPPANAGSDFGVLFMHNEGFSTMCGHGIIALSTVAVETGLVRKRIPETVLRIDTPAGLVTSRVTVSRGRVSRVSFRNVPSFVLVKDGHVDVPGIGNVHYDIAFGGAFYAYVKASEAGLTCSKGESAILVSKGMAIKKAVMKSRPLAHPDGPDLAFLYGTIFIAPPRGKGADIRNVCIFADGQIDRSPTGTGVSGLAAIRFADGEMNVGEALKVESIIGTTFVVRVAGTTTVGGFSAIIPEVEGSAHITGRHEFLLDAGDDLAEGFIV